MIGFFSVFEVMELQGDFMEESYDPGEYKYTWILIVSFPHCTSIYIYIYIYIYKTCIFTTMMK
jgi:hypothetical protein